MTTTSRDPRLPRATGRRTAAAVTAAAALFALSGCGGDSADGAPGSTTTTASGTAGAQPTGSASASASSGSTVAPAAGPSVESPAFTVNIPAKWHVVDPSDHDAISAVGPLPEAIGLLTADTFGNVRSLRQQARNTERALNAVHPQVRLDAELAGEPAYVLTWSDSLLRHVAYGATHGDKHVTISFQSRKPAADLPDRIDSVLATFQWR